MKKTLKDIAKECGVTIGTVDRVLHKRIGVSEQTREMVQKVIDKYNYKPNTLAKALKRMNKKKIIAVVTINKNVNSFAKELIDGINDSYLRIKDFNIDCEWYFLESFDVKEQLEILKKLYLKDNINAIIIRPINDKRIKKMISKFTEKGVKVCTVVSDVENLSNIYTIKNDHIKEGQFMASIILKMINIPKIAFVTGNKIYRNHELKIKGVKKYLEKKYKNGIFEVFDITYNYQETIVEIKKMNPTAIIIQSLDKYGIIKLVNEFKNIKISAFGTKKDLKDIIKKDILTFGIDENPYAQGELAMKTIFEALIYENLETKFIEVDTQIITDI